jgi:hypothetical protein
MKRKVVFSFLRLENPDADAWKEIVDFAENWNKERGGKLSNAMNIMLSLTFADETDPELDDFIDRLRAIERRHQIRYSARAEAQFDETDYRNADFVEIQGVGLTFSDGRHLVLNEDQALGAPVACPTCGWVDVFDKPQNRPFVIDEALLDASPEGEQQPSGGWDCVNLPNGHKLVSRRFVSSLETHDVHGFECLEVLEHGTGRPSRRMVQLLARRAIPALKPIGKWRAELAICQTCGAARQIGTEAHENKICSPPDYCVERDQIGDDEIFSRHPGRGAMLHISGRAYAELKRAGVDGLFAGKIVRFCDGGAMSDAGVVAQKRRTPDS